MYIPNEHHTIRIHGVVGAIEGILHTDREFRMIALSRPAVFLTMVLVLFAVVFGCSKAKIDGSTDESMRSSLEIVKRGLSTEERARFDQAIAVLARGELDGKTGSEVIAEGERIIQERKQNEQNDALSEIADLEQRRAAAEKDRPELEKFEVLSSRFYRQWTGDTFQPIIELRVMNGTAHTVTKAHFIGILWNMEETLPWVREPFNHEIKGGLSRGAEASWILPQSVTSTWGTIGTPENVIFTSLVELLAGENGETLFSTQMFTKQDEIRLRKLKQQQGS